MKKISTFSKSLTFVIIVSFVFFTSLQAQQYVAVNRQALTIDLSQLQINKEEQVAKLSTTLNQLNSTYKSGGNTTEIINRFQLNTKENRIIVTVLPERQGILLNIDESRLKQYGAIIQFRSKNSLRVEIPISQLQNIAENVNGIKFISEPIRPHEDAVTSEGVALMNADEWNTAGIQGAGVKVAVIDGGFIDLTAAQANGDIPASYISQDFTGGGLQAGTQHGTAVAEAVYDVAPQAELYLYRISDITDFENAVDACIANGVNIVNHSMSWFNVGGYYDGTGLTCDIVNNALSSGILWVNSAGNSALDHYRATFLNDGSGYHDFSGSGGNINLIGPEPGYAYYHQPGDIVRIALNWNNYPTTTQDYDLYIYRWTGSAWSLAANSINDQTSGAAPEEFVSFTNSYTDGIYGVVVVRFSASTDVDFTLFSLGLGLAYHTESSSLADPASVTDVITVGAIDRVNYTSGPQEDFSSQGPTTDGRIKPDVAAPDNCNSFAYGYWNGTSLSSPHTAGICALIKSNNPSYSVSDIQNYLSR